MTTAAAAAAAPAVQSQPVGPMIDQIYKLKQERRALEREIKGINAKIAALETDVLKALDEQGASSLKALSAKASIVEDQYPEPEDWSEIYDYIKDNDAFYLLQRRLTSTTWNELRKQGVEIPGIRAVPKRTLSVTKA